MEKAIFPYSLARTITDIRCAAILKGLIAFYCYSVTNCI